MTQNIEQRTLAAVNQYEHASATSHKLTNTDDIIDIDNGQKVKSLPRISKEWDAEREALSVKAKPVKGWVAGETETDLNQQRRFTDGHTYLPKTVPAIMNAEPDANWIAYTADKSDVLSDVFGSKPVDLTVGLVITSTTNQYPKLAAFNAIYELADNSVSYTVKSFAQSADSNSVIITLNDNSQISATKVDSASKNWVTEEARILADETSYARPLRQRFSDEINVNDENIYADGTDISEKLAKLVRNTTKTIVFPDSEQPYIISARTEQFSSLSSNVITPLHTITSTGTVVLKNGKLLRIKFSSGHLQSETGDYTVQDNSISLLVAPISSDVFIVSTTPIEVVTPKSVKMLGSARLRLIGDYAVAPTIRCDTENLVIESGGRFQTGVAVWGAHKKHSIIKSTDFEIVPLRFGIDNLAGLYYSDFDIVDISNSTDKPAQVGVTFGGDFPQSNVNNVNLLTIRGAQVNKFQCEGTQNTVKHMDFVGANSFIVERALWFSKNAIGNEIESVYEEVSNDNRLSNVLVEFGSENDPINGGICSGNSVNISVESSFEAMGTRIKDWTGMNDVKCKARLSSNYASGYGARAKENLFKNPSFLTREDGTVSCVLGNNTSRIAISDIGYASSAASSPDFASKYAMKIAFNNSKEPVHIFYASDNAEPDYTAAQPNGFTRFFKDIEYFRGKYVSVGAWMFWDGTQDELDKNNIQIVATILNGGERIKKARRWEFITNSTTVPFSTDFSTIDNRLGSYISPFVNTTGNLYVTGLQIIVGDNVHPQGVSDSLSKGGYVLNDLIFPKSTNGQSPQLQINGWYLWVDDQGNVTTSKTKS